MRDELASDSKIQKGSKQSDVNTARLKGKLPNLIWGGLPTEKKVGRQKSAEAIVVDGVTTIQGG